MFGAIVSLIFFAKGKLILLFVLLSFANHMSFLLTNLQAANAKKSLDSFYVGEEINHCWEFVISYYPLVKTAD